MNQQRPAISDPWHSLRRHTPARIALGRAGGSLPTAELLRFAADHAAARDAVFAPFAAESLAAELQAALPGLTPLIVSSQVRDRREHLRRPDLGQLLEPLDAERCTALAGMGEISLVIGDGLSPWAVERQAPRVCSLLAEGLARAGRSLAPPVIVRHARVAIGDEIASRLGARVVVVFVGERPGLGTPDSMGAYLTVDPRPGRRNSERSCVSNIHAGGLQPAAAANEILALILGGLRLGASGIALSASVGAGPLLEPE